MSSYPLGMTEVEGRGRLVEQQQPRLLRERPGQDGPLPLTARQGAQCPVRERGELQPLERGADDVAVVATRPDEQGAVGVRPRSTYWATVTASGRTGICGA